MEISEAYSKIHQIANEYPLSNISFKMGKKILEEEFESILLDKYLDSSKECSIERAFDTFKKNSDKELLELKHFI